ncbi:response regulator transcription factor [Micromonospora sp. WMMD1102]|uniref:response regulator transcription factor n=1 Tax=Micromonospora sp. WMMD1102 TaxID=3016105 RepID=UPI002414DE4F|nr:response regulator transcription factor [Micromonospora sp. WMMD1102]MDG4784846.1 response regulator transcription factor [Micromonospora sp. WMMD1102]
MTANLIRVALADDHTLFRQGIREMLSTDPGIQVVGEAATGPDAVGLVLAERPDVLLLDVEMPGPGAGPVIRELRRVRPQTQVVVLTMHDDADVVRDLLNCGAAAYLVKTILRDELVVAVRSVASRSDTVLLSVSRRTVSQLDSQRDRAGNSAGPLTDRELEVLTLTAQAFSNAQIASRLHITQATVKRHLTNIYAKLQAVSRVDAIRKATAARLIDPDGGPLR